MTIEINDNLHWVQFMQNVNNFSKITLLLFGGYLN